MYKILVATDGSEHSDKAIQEALTIAEPLKAEVTILTVIREHTYTTRTAAEISDDTWKRVNKFLQDDAEEITEKAAKPFRGKGLPVNTKVITELQSEADAICKEAQEGNYNLIVLGSHGLRGIKEMILGSVSNKVAHICSVSVLIAK